MSKSNNKVFKRTLNLLSFRDKNHILEVFKIGGLNNISKSQIEKWKSIKDDNKEPMPDEALVAFFDGLDELSRAGDIVCYYNFGADNE